jgi:hypothetical protein
LLFGHLVRRGNNFNLFFSLDRWTKNFTSFLETPNISNSVSIWARGEFLFKMDCNFSFLVFFEEPLCVAMWLKLPKGSRAGCQKKVFFAHRISDFHFFLQHLLFSNILFFPHGSTWCHLQCNHSDCMWSLWFFSRNFTSSTMLEFESRPPSTKWILAQSYLQIQR